MQIQLSDHFTTGKLLRFVIPSIVMMIFTSIYWVVDGFFISNYVGKTAFAAVNLIMPFPMALSTIGFMLGTGGSALVAKTLGEGKRELANSYFSLIVYATIILGGALSVVGYFAVPWVAKTMGAEGQMLEDCILYGGISIAGGVTYMLQNVFQSFFVTAEKPKLGLAVTVAAGVTNMFLDWLLIGFFRFGIAGAAWTTICSQTVGGVIPLIYFYRKNDSLLQLGKTKFHGRALLHSCANGMSEMMTNLSLSIVNVAYNAQLMRFAGENGVAAYGTIMYVNFIFIAGFIGYSIGVAPVVGYHYGSQNRAELKNLLKKSTFIIGIFGAMQFLASLLLSGPLSQLFVGYDEALYELTSHAFRLYAFFFFFAGFNICGSGFFTALNNGVVSAILSFFRTLVFQIAGVMLLPLILGIDGVWLSVTVAEILSLIMTVFFLWKYRKKYGYL